MTFRVDAPFQKKDGASSSRAKIKRTRRRNNMKLNRIGLAREHYLNVIHIWCRLCDIGVPDGCARAIARALCWKLV